MDIERNLPTHKSNIEYTFRYRKETFDKYNKLHLNLNLQNNYLKWKSGINYKTNKKVKLGGKIHNELSKEFTIEIPYRKKDKQILIEELDGINYNEYELETYKIYKQIDTESTSINEYNKSIDNILEEISKLDRWADYVEFEGKNHGIPIVYNGVHRRDEFF